MVYNQVHIPLGKEFEAGSFRKHHAKHRVSLLDTAFLAAPHRVTVINAGTLDSLNSSLKIVRSAEFHSSVRQDIFEQRQELSGARPPFHTVEDHTDFTGGTAVQHESQKELFLCQKERQQDSVRLTGRMNSVHFCKSC